MGGKNVLPDSTSLRRKRLRFRKSGLIMSSFRSSSQLSSNVLISNCRSDFCSTERDCIHACLSNLVADGLSVDDTTFGCPKNEVKVAFALGFFASFATASAAFLFKDMADDDERYRSARMTILLVQLESD
jgi:hypothetical protein